MSSVLRFDEWQDSDGNPVFNGAGGVSPGGLIATKYVQLTTPFTASSIGAGASAAVTGLSLTHEVADASNKLIITAFFGAMQDSSGRSAVGIAVNDGTSLLTIGDASGSRTSVTAGGRRIGTGDGTTAYSSHITIQHVPGAGSKTYTVHAVNIDGQNRTLFINRNTTNADGGSTPAAASVLQIMEVAV